MADPVRVPPCDLDSEAACLCAIMVDPRAIDAIAPFLRSEHFYSESHRRIYEAAIELHAIGQPVDAVQIGARLKASGRIEQVGGMAYLTEIINGTASVTHLNVEAYANTVRLKWRERQLIAVCQRIAAEGYCPHGETTDYIEKAEQAIYAVAREAETTTLHSLGTVMQASLAELSRAAARGDQMTGVSSGFDRYDRLTAGFHDGDLTIIAARPGMGKTSFALNVATNVAQPRLDGEEPGLGVIVFSIEMPKEQLANRTACSEAQIDLSKIRVPKIMGARDWSNLGTVAATIFPLPIWIDESTRLSVLDVRAKVRRKQAEFDRPAAHGKAPHRISLVIIDYLQLMVGAGNESSREQEIGSISRGLKGLAKDLRVPVVALAQLNRSTETRSEKSKRPQLSDLRESGSLEQDADNVCFIYRDDYYNPDSAEKNIAELILAKQRNGPTGTAKVRFAREYTRFFNLAEGEYVDDEPG